MDGFGLKCIGIVYLGGGWIWFFVFNVVVIVFVFIVVCWKRLLIMIWCFKKMDFGIGCFGKNGVCCVFYIVVY